MRRGLLVFMVVLAACGDGSGPGGDERVVVSGLPAADTVRARLPGPIIVSLRDSSGGPLAGVHVTFDAMPPDSAPLGRPAMLVATDSQMHFGASATGITDTRGRTWALVLLGCSAGPARLRVRASSTNLDTTVSIDLRPGKPTHFVADPADTMVFVGSSYVLRAGTRDDCENPVAGATTLTAGSGAIRISHDTITGLSVDRTMIIASSDTLVDTAWATPVPRASMTALPYFACAVLERRDLDGTHAVRLSIAAMSAAGCFQATALAKSGTLFASVPNTSGWNEIWSADFSSPPQRVLGCVSTCLPVEWPQLNPAGTRLYFGQRTASFGGSYEFWTSLPDGSGARKFVQSALTIIHPSISPDERRVAFVTAPGQAIQVYDSLTATVSATSVGGDWPAWSPDGTRIAYVSNNTVLVLDRTTGGAWQLASIGSALTGPLAWTPDSKWVVASGGIGGSDRMLWLLEARNGPIHDVPIPLTLGYSQPAIRPLP